MLSNSLTEFAFHQAVLTDYVIPSERGIWSPCCNKPNRLSTLDSALLATLRCAPFGMTCVQGMHDASLIFSLLKICQRIT